MEEDKNLDGSDYYKTPQDSKSGKDSRSGSKRHISKFRTESATIEEPYSPLMPQDTED